MLKNYLKIAFRNLLRKKGYSFINIAGLAVGIACCIIILLYVQKELRYDTFHEHSDRIYRVHRTHTGSGGSDLRHALSNFVMAPILEENNPDIIEAVRLAPQEEKVSYGNDVFKETRFFYTESSFFDIFTVKMLAGNPENALSDPFSVVLTRETARKYFGTQNPIGKQLSITRDEEYLYTVTGVVEEFPESSHIQFDFLANIESTRNWFSEEMYNQWGNMWMYTYVLVEPGTDISGLERQLKPVISSLGPPELEQFNIRFTFFPLEDIHLYSNTNSELSAGGNAVFIYVFMAVAVIVLAIACFNFINLATARSTWRAKEVGMRKALGAHRGNLVKQFIGESFLISLLSLLLAIGIVELILPYINSFIGSSLELQPFENLYIFSGLLAIILLVGFLAGSYPAFVLSSFQPSRVLKGDTSLGNQNMTTTFRKSLVVLQFTLTTILIIGALVIYSQLDFIKNKDLGLSNDRVLIVNLDNSPGQDKIDLLKQTFLQEPSVLGISAASDALPDELNSWRVRLTKSPENSTELLKVMAVDQEFFDLLNIPVERGRVFSRDRSDDESSSVVLNQAAVRHFGLNGGAVGTGFYFETMDMQKDVIGVVNDFHTKSLYNEIIPVSFHLYPSWYDQLYIKIDADDISTTIASLQEQWESIVPDWPFEYNFMDDAFDRQYRKDEKLAQLIGLFSMLAIFVACLGLLGLASFTIERRFKEIGIRKVLGATSFNIVSLLSQDYIYLVLISLVLATPVSLLLLKQWLANFSYQISIGPSYFISAGLIVLGVALFTVSWQSFRAVTMNPVDSLRNE